MNRPHPAVVTPGKATLPEAAPSDAVMLFDGTDLSQWEPETGDPSAWTIENDYMEVDRQSNKPAPWKVENGYFEVVAGSGYIRTKQTFGDIQLHVEWATPTLDRTVGKGQDQGNSGIFLMGLYEVQVLDSYQNPTYADGQAAALYGQYPPLFNASRPPGEWQSYDIFFRHPRFGAAGQMLAPARVTVIQNGVLVQNDVALWGVPLWLQHLPYRPHADRLPIVLQDHGNPVRFRNIWVRPLLETRPVPPPGYETTTHGIRLSHKEMDRYVGRYGTWEIHRVEDVLRMHFFGPLWLEIVPLSPTHFVLKHTAADLRFDLSEQGVPQSVTFIIGGVPQTQKRVL